MYLAVSYYSLKGLDDSYDALRLSDMTLALEAGRAPSSLGYLIGYDSREDRHVRPGPAGGHPPP